MVGFEEMRDELLERIEDLLKRKQYTALRDLLADLEPADIASLFEDLDEDSIPLLFRLLPKEPAAEVFVERRQAHLKARGPRHAQEHQ